MMQYIKVYDNVFSELFCKELIEKFEEHRKELVHRNSSWEQDYKRFDELCITHYPEFSELQEEFYSMMGMVVDQYVAECNVEFFPKEFGYEEMRMKCYDNNGKDKFGIHADVGDYPSARRFLVLFTYLNDVEVGGETVFYNQSGNEYVVPKTGSVVAFPPFWTYPHQGMKPISSKKYICSTYLHYIS